MQATSPVQITSNAKSVHFGFRPWVRRAGASIAIVAAAITVAIVLTLAIWPPSRYGWIGEPFVWVYIGTLWAGGLKVWLGTRRPVAEADPETLLLRPLHQFRARRIGWESLRGTEQMIGGDRMIVYFDTARGMRFVALNLNLIRGRREFLLLVEARLKEMGFVEKVVERSRYLSRAVGDSAFGLEG
ncbi:MAG: hypothetical protein ABI779_01920 [Acidobacteriota bacterium]